MLRTTQIAMLDRRLPAGAEDDTLALARAKYFAPNPQLAPTLIRWTMPSG